MRLTQAELDLLVQAVLYYGFRYGLQGVPEFESLAKKAQTMRDAPDQWLRKSLLDYCEVN